MRILFLYSEIADYFLACVNTLVQMYDIHVKLIKWKVNAEAPFKFIFESRIEVQDKQHFSFKELNQTVTTYKPDLIFVAGWMDKDYLKIIHTFDKRIPIVCGLDNPWKGSLKQHLATLLSPFTIQSYFTHVWCAGIQQYEYARKLGFKQEQILLGLYSANTELFTHNNISIRQKQIIYAGRLLNWKGIKELYNAFTQLQEEQFPEWRLLFVGRGEMRESLPETDNVNIIDFVQPSELVNLFSKSSIFCLPSWQEHWGVVVHEAAAAGLPILVSNGVGAGTAFVKNGYNGYIFKAKDEASLKYYLKKLMEKKDEELLKMGNNSMELSRQITPEIWASTLMSVLQNS